MRALNKTKQHENMMMREPRNSSQFSLEVPGTAMCHDGGLEDATRPVWAPSCPVVLPDPLFPGTNGCPESCVPVTALLTEEGLIETTKIAFYRLNKI